MERQGIVGRGILVDFVNWLEKAPKDTVPAEAREFRSFERTPIKLEWVHQILEFQGTVPRYGDILFTRTGFPASYTSLSDAQIATLQSMTPPHLGGLEQSDALLEWIWNHFSAVAGDQPSFEMWPTPFEWSCHEVLLAGWGCPIGELFDLEELGRTCERLGRWSFFVTSEVVNVPGGVASPGNALAIF